jgi:hypothetical protein
VASPAAAQERPPWAVDGERPQASGLVARDSAKDVTSLAGTQGEPPQVGRSEQLSGNKPTVSGSKKKKAQVDARGVRKKSKKTAAQD